MTRGCGVKSTAGLVGVAALLGLAASSVEARDPIITRVTGAGGALLGFTANRLQYRLRIQDYVTAVSVTYGVLDALDANLLIPLIQTNFAAGVTSQQEFTAGPDGTFTPSAGPPRTGSTKGDTFGVGDLLLRLKYQLPQQGGLKSAAGLQLRLPSGREEDFQGIGSFEASPSFFASTVVWSRVEPYVNGAIDLLADDVGRSQARYGVGFDVDATRRLGLAFAFLGRSEFERSAPAGETDFLHLVSGTPALRPLLGIAFEDPVEFLSLGLGRPAGTATRPGRAGLGAPLAAEGEAGRDVLLLVEEAQALPASTLAGLPELIQPLTGAGGSALQVLLAGQ